MSADAQPLPVLEDAPTAPHVLPRATRRPWVEALAPAMRGELLLGIRSHDTFTGQVLAAPLPRYLRAQVFDDPSPETSHAGPPPSLESFHELITGGVLGAFSFQFVTHLMAAARIVASHHPQADVRAYCLRLHGVFCAALSLPSRPPRRRAQPEV